MNPSNAIELYIRLDCGALGHVLVHVFGTVHASTDLDGPGPEFLRSQIKFATARLFDETGKGYRDVPVLHLLDHCSKLDITEALEARFRGFKSALEAEPCFDWEPGRGA